MVVRFTQVFECRIVAEYKYYDILGDMDWNGVIVGWWK